MPDWFAEIFGSLIQQAREEIVDRGWFQRNPMHSQRADHHDRPLDEQAGWSQRDQPGRDHGMDR